MRLLVFGCRGHVGNVFIQRAKTEGHDIITVSSKKDTPADMYLDFTDEDAVLAFRLPQSTSIDGVFFCQGINPSIGLGDTSFAHFRRMWEVNISSPAIIVRKLVCNVQKGGAFLFLGSPAITRGSYDPAYGSAKAAVIGLMNSLGRYLPDHRFNVISPALISGSPVARSMTPTHLESHSKEMFQGALIDAGNIASLALELFKNQNINRAVVSIDGGMRA